MRKEVRKAQFAHMPSSLPSFAFLYYIYRNGRLCGQCEEIDVSVAFLARLSCSSY